MGGTSDRLGTSLGLQASGCYPLPARKLFGDERSGERQQGHGLQASLAHHVDFVVEPACGVALSSLLGSIILPLVCVGECVHVLLECVRASLLLQHASSSIIADCVHRRALLRRHSRKERVLPEPSDRPQAVLSSASVLLQLWSVSHSSSLRHSPTILSSPNVCASSDAHSASGGSSLQRSGDLCSGSSLFQRALLSRPPTSGSIIYYSTCGWGRLLHLAIYLNVFINI